MHDFFKLHFYGKICPELKPASRLLVQRENIFLIIYKKKAFIKKELKMKDVCNFRLLLLISFEGDSPS